VTRSTRLFALILGSLAFNLFAQAPPSFLDDTLALEEVTVSTTKIEVQEFSAPLSITSIHSEAIESSSESALFPILSEQVPGLFITERGVTGFGVSTGAAGQISMRGIGGNPTSQVLILLNGNPQYMGIMGHPLADAYTTSGVERVEVIRSPASMLYGSNAMGGVINIITREPHDDGAHASVKAQYGSFNTAKLMAHASWKHKKLSFYGGIGYDRTDGHRDSSDFHILNSTLRGNYQLNSHLRIYADWSMAHFEAQDPGAFDASAGERINIHRGMYSVGADNRFGKTQGSLRFFRNFGEHSITDGFHSKDYNYGLALHQSVNLWKGQTLTLGSDMKQFGGRAENVLAMQGKGLMLLDTSLYERAGYMLLRQELFSGRLFLNGGYRMDYHSNAGWEPVPMAGITWRGWEKTIFKASVAKGFRNPTLRELYMFGTANDQLKAEDMVNTEVSVIQHFWDDKFRTELTMYYAEGHNLIGSRTLAGRTQLWNTGHFIHKGVELLASCKLNRQFSVTANYSGLNMDDPVPGTPEQQWYANLKFKQNKWGAYLAWQHIHHLNLTQLNGSWVKENYHLLNTGIDYRVNHWVQFFLKADNLLNASYEMNAGYPMPGIMGFVGINVNL